MKRFSFFTGPRLRIPKKSGDRIAFDQQTDQTRSHYFPTELPLNINQKTLPFPLTTEGLNGLSVREIGKWAVPDVPGRAPFLNRRKVLVNLLLGCYRNVERLHAKPFYSVFTLAKGSGKSRLLSEWIYQALNNPEVVNDFLTSTTITHAADSLLKRKRFINSLYEAAFKQRIIFTQGVDIEPPQQDQDDSTFNLNLE